MLLRARKLLNTNRPRTVLTRWVAGDNNTKHEERERARERERKRMREYAGSSWLYYSTVPQCIQMSFLPHEERELPFLPLLFLLSSFVSSFLRDLGLRSLVSDVSYSIGTLYRPAVYAQDARSLALFYRIRVTMAPNNMSFRIMHFPSFLSRWECRATRTTDACRIYLSVEVIEPVVTVKSKPARVFPSSLPPSPRLQSRTTRKRAWIHGIRHVSTKWERVSGQRKRHAVDGKVRLSLAREREPVVPFSCAENAPLTPDNGTRTLCKRFRAHSRPFVDTTVIYTTLLFREIRFFLLFFLFWVRNLSSR